MISLDLFLKRSLHLLLIILFSELNYGVTKISYNRVLENSCQPSIEFSTECMLYKPLRIKKTLTGERKRNQKPSDSIWVDIQKNEIDINVQGKTTSPLIILTILSILTVFISGIYNKSLYKSKLHLDNKMEILALKYKELNAENAKIKDLNQRLIQEKSIINDSNIILKEKTKILIGKINQIKTNLLKPLTKMERLQKSSEKAINFKAIKDGNINIKLKFIDVVSSKKNTLIIKTNIGKIYKTKGPLYAFKEKHLPESLFVQVHKSQIINLTRIQIRNDLHFKMIDGSIQSIGPNYKRHAEASHNSYEAIKSQAYS